MVHDTTVRPSDLRCQSGTFMHIIIYLTCIIIHTHIMLMKYACTIDSAEKEIYFHKVINTNLFIIRFGCEQTGSKDQSNQSSNFTHDQAMLL